MDAVDQVDDRAGDLRLVVEAREALLEVADVGHGAAEALAGPHDPDVVPHRVPDRRPVLLDEGRVLVLRVAGRLPVGVF